jgi:branched-chain amino acid transport system substrate-binding protein
LALGAAGLVGACSALIEHADSECSTDRDCEWRFPGTRCVQGGCSSVYVEAGLGDLGNLADLTCTSTQECLAVHGPNWICSPSTSSCVSLTSTDCSQVVGQYTAEDVVLVGALLPLTGPHQSTGLAIQQGVRLAVGDLLPGLPPLGDGGLPRALAVVFCDESDNLQRAANHLTNELGAQIILGTGESASTRTIATSVTSTGGEFLISPRATADLSAFAGTGLVWRTCPGDGLEAAAISDLVQGIVAPALQAQYGLARVKVAVVHAVDVESTDIDARIVAAFGAGNADAGDAGIPLSWVDVNYGDPDDPNIGAKYTTAIGQTLASAPDLIVLVGETQAVTNVLSGIEMAWSSLAGNPRRPRYVLSSATETTELLALATSNADLRGRILGTAPGANPNDYLDLRQFMIAYQTTFGAGSSPEIFGVAQAYDAVYVIAYAAAAVSKANLVGSDVTAALRRILSADAGAPVVIDVGPDGVSTAFGAIQAGRSIALNGASAPLAFDPQRGDLATDVQVWCIAPRGGDGGMAFVSSGATYYAASRTLDGSVGAPCGP